MNLAIVFVAVCAAVHSAHGACTNDCSGGGTCSEDDVCTCRVFFSGEDCSDAWREDQLFRTLFRIYGYYAVVLQAICVIYSGFQLGVSFMFSKKFGWKKWTAITYILIMGVTGGMIRVIIYTLDPHAFFEIVDEEVESIMFDIPMILWLAAGFLLLFYWIELQAKSGLHELHSITRFRPALIVLSIVLTVLIVPISMWNFVQNTVLSSAAYNGILVFSFMVLIGLSAYYGWGLSRILSHIWKSTKNFQSKRFLRKLTHYIFVLDITLVVTIVTLVLYTALGIFNSKWPFIIFHTILRFEEFMIVMCTLIFVGKKRPKPEKSSSKFGTTELSASRGPTNHSDRADNERN